ncbi:pectic acid lyase [Haloferula helveola]|uniref:Pectic acid lyase n=1 Tax=Haloferula helveola TaxID=490095 RepID=A0ABM7R7P5_9BACT|nr:pectic acid lyase [Haloferula helveola]
MAAPEPAEVKDAIVKAVATMRGTYGRHGGYVWVYSPDGKLRAGEGPAGETSAWVQPPGTPTVGESFLAAYRATGDRVCREAALEVARALVKGQLHSGGWNYRIDFDPRLRKQSNYRIDGGKAPKAGGPAGWDTWRKRRNKGNRSMLDDDTTQAALRFLLEVDRELKFADKEIHDCVLYGLEALIGTQYPVGAWSHNFDSFPDPPVSEADYPVMRASIPDEWPHTWPNAWNGCYHLNDNITTDAIRTLLLAHEVLGDRKYLEAAMRGGDFLIKAQLPEPQPAWAQQYDKRMVPVWERKFEPPAVTGGESQGALLMLLELHRATGEPRFLEPVGPALRYLEKSRLPDGQLARYYELRTNRPLYFTKDYQLTHDDSDVPTHYAFKVGSKLERIRREFDAAKSGKAPKAGGPPSDREVERILSSRNDEGIWLESGAVRDGSGKKVETAEGVLNSGTFAKNLRTLSDWLDAEK